MHANTLTFIWLLLAIAYFGATRLCLVYERKSRKWWPDRVAIFLAGFFFALGCVASVAVIVGLA